MILLSPHTFHIPVLGIGFSVDAPLKVARYGISSVVSLVDDSLLEELRHHHLRAAGLHFEPIDSHAHDSRAKRITAYLNMLGSMVGRQFDEIRSEPFHDGADIHRYFELLPDSSALKSLYTTMLRVDDPALRQGLEEQLRHGMRPGGIEVNIMTKLDKANFGSDGEPLGMEHNDAHAALRGFAVSDLESAIVFSAGMNPRLYSYLSTFPDFQPDATGRLKKRIVIKVSDFRSALIQGKFLAKKGLWVSEYRIESGLNCGGHAFATDGLLLGPILDEFRQRRSELDAEQREICSRALNARGVAFDDSEFQIRVTAQGGVGTADEHTFLLRHYGIDSVGWGSPFLLVPEVMNISPETLVKLQAAKVEDLYLSDVSPLGVPFNNLRGNDKDEEKAALVREGKPGSPCIKKFLSFNTDFSDKPLCTASIAYLKKKTKALREQMSSEEDYQEAFDVAVDKACLCEGLTVTALNVNSIEVPKLSKAVSVCPGPNIAYFSRVASLREMVDHIYGRLNLITDHDRPNLFVKELHLYVDYLQRMIVDRLSAIPERTDSYLQTFCNNLLEGIRYYRELLPDMHEEAEQMLKRIREELNLVEEKLRTFALVPA